MSKTAYKVLFLEDEPTIREVLTEYMLMSGYEVCTASRGDTAIALLKEQTFDLAVLDICVPGADGFEVLKQIQETLPDCRLEQWWGVAAKRLYQIVACDNFRAVAQ